MYGRGERHRIKLPKQNQRFMSTKKTFKLIKKKDQNRDESKSFTNQEGVSSAGGSAAGSVSRSAASVSNGRVSDILELIRNKRLECMICFDKIKDFHAIWSCHCCW